jgi:hypothetical protein
MSTRAKFLMKMAVTLPVILLSQATLGEIIKYLLYRVSQNAKSSRAAVAVASFARKLSMCTQYIFRRCTKDFHVKTHFES